MFRYFIILSVLIAAVHTTGFGFSVGPFNFGGSDTYTYPTYNYRGGQRAVGFGKSQICNAIAQQKKVQLIIKQIDKSDKELKITVKKIVFEPYVFGLDQNRGPVLRGQVVDEKVLKEVTVKSFEDKNAPQDEAEFEITPQEQQEIKTATALPAKGEIGEINLRRVKNFRVIQDSHFDTPKDFDKIFKDTMIQVFCQINRPVEK